MKKTKTKIGKSCLSQFAISFSVTCNLMGVCTHALFAGNLVSITKQFAPSCSKPIQGLIGTCSPQCASSCSLKPFRAISCVIVWVKLSHKTWKGLACVSHDRLPQHCIYSHNALSSYSMNIWIMDTGKCHFYREFSVSKHAHHLN